MLQKKIPVFIFPVADIENGAQVFSGHICQKIQHRLPVGRIQPLGGLIQDQQPGPLIKARAMSTSRWSA
jgi:hypothetical protein